MTRKAAYWILLGALTQTTLVGCGDDDDDDSTAKGGSTSAHGGATSTSGGKTGTGGHSSGGSGTNDTGGASSGGATALGGNSAVAGGGAENAGGQSGGEAGYGQGGTPAHGGSHSGGSTASGGAQMGLAGGGGAGGEEENYGGQAGSGGEGGAGGATSVTFAEVTALFQAHCVGCHSGADARIDLSSSAGLYGRLTTPMVGTPTCEGKTLVVANEVANSFIVEKTTSATPACGGRMPAGCSTTGTPRACLTVEEEGLLALWITQGAPN